MRIVPLLAASLLAFPFSLTAALAPLPDVVAPIVPDRQPALVPDRIQLGGMVGRRVLGNERDRLLAVDTDRLLEGYRKRPGRQSWDGEHVGKWLHAATLAWANTGDAALRAKMDRTVTALLACQLDDGYLGTYLDKDRWTDWDVWAHKYNLIGLLTYERYTGNQSVVPACRKMADLLCRTFGDEPGQRDIIAAGHHVGLAPTSVLEPMALLYRATGEKRYLDFCQYLLRAWEHPNGPHLVSRLLAGEGVNRVGNGKAYEMLSCLNGVLELYRTTGEASLLTVARNAWSDIVAHQLYLTGTASYEELFHEPDDLPNLGNVGETCVTVTWIQLNAQLLRLTGDARYAEELERSVLNQLLGAQQPDCTAWGYYVQMEGKKPYSSTLDGHCCLSSGPRGVALIPTFATSADADGVVVNLYGAGETHLSLADGTAVTLRQETNYPADGRITLELAPEKASSFALKLRVPQWAQDAKAQVNGEPVALAKGPDGYAAISRLWKPQDRVELSLPFAPHAIAGSHANEGRMAFVYGPLVYAADQQLLGGERALPMIALPPIGDASVAGPAGKGELPRLRAHALLRSATDPYHHATPTEVELLPFAEAGGTGSEYRVWLPVFQAAHENLALLGRPSFSRELRGHWGPAGSIVDGNRHASAMLKTEPRVEEDWCAVTLPLASAVRRVVFYQGWVSPQGGWFDTSASAPRVEIQEKAGGDWRPAGALPGYPATTSASAGELKTGERFELVLPTAAHVVGVRVIGRPAGGNAPTLPYLAVAELELYSE